MGVNPAFTPPRAFYDPAPGWVETTPPPEGPVFPNSTYVIDHPPGATSVQVEITGTMRVIQPTDTSPYDGSDPLAAYSAVFGVVANDFSYFGFNAPRSVPIEGFTDTTQSFSLSTPVLPIVNPTGPPEYSIGASVGSDVNDGFTWGYDAEIHVYDVSIVVTFEGVATARGWVRGHSWG